MYNLPLGACFDNDLDSYGLDIQSEIEGITSAAACQELCNSNAECNYFTYGNTVLSGKCWLKSAKAIALTSYPGLISGPKTCGKQLLDKIIIPMIFGYILCKYISECIHIIHLFIFRVIRRVNPEIDEIADYTIIL